MWDNVRVTDDGFHSFASEKSFALPGDRRSTWPRRIQYYIIIIGTVLLLSFRIRLFASTDAYTIFP